ncbi:hypothetical protein [Paraburkholderia phosphatilytica]|uniref:hypothetical protein n=1 Tax=Paraburkholderia phosphatilytica TaxID=2282883 RepID=UPI000E4BB458|nr:hypothetical protein [Paraburkholderia phosphatilytica]
MTEEISALARAVIEQYGLSTIEQVVRVIPLHMCHITQEPDVFGTWPANVMRLRHPQAEWAHHEAVYARYRDEIIPSLGLADYLRAFVEADAPRLPCFCTEMSDVAGTLASVLLAQPVYAIRQLYVDYLYLPQRWHSLNAFVVDGRIRYFDSSAYRQVFDRQKRKFMRPEELAGFDAADVTPHFIGDDWLQREPMQRAISFDGNAIHDTFCPNPFDTSRPDQFLRVYGAHFATAPSRSHVEHMS